VVPIQKKYGELSIFLPPKSAVSKTVPMHDVEMYKPVDRLSILPVDVPHTHTLFLGQTGDVQIHVLDEAETHQRVPTSL
jgi:hypothetical protein